MVKRFATALVLIVLLTMSTGAAATLGVVGSPLGSGTAPVTRCGDTSAVTVGYSIDLLGNVTGATLAGLPASCNGATATVVLTVGSVAVATAGPVTVSAGAASLPLATPLLAVTAAGLTATRVSLQGP